MSDHEAHAQEIESVIRVAAKAAIREFVYGQDLKNIIEESVNNALEKLGIDTQDPEATRRDMVHLRNWTETMATIKKTGVATVVKTLISGGIATILIGLGYIYSTHPTPPTH